MERSTSGEVSHLGARRIRGDVSCARILLVGEDNPYGADPRYALFHKPVGSAGHRLQSKVMGVRARSSYLSMWRTNLCARRWSIEEAEDRASLLLDGIGACPWTRIILLGSKVLSAFRRASIGRDTAPVLSVGTLWSATRLGELERAQGLVLEPFAIFESSGLDLMVMALPHPSGRCRSWNDPSSVSRARALFRRAAPGVGWGDLDTVTGPSESTMTHASSCEQT